MTIFRRILKPEVMRLIAEAGFRAVLYKDHFYLGVAHAVMLEKLLPDTGVRLFSGLALNNASGGINPHAVNFYRQVRDGLDIDCEMSNDSAFYYAARDEFNALIRAGLPECRRAAQLFFYLNRTGYNGLCRFNRKGEFNVPFGRYARLNYARDFAAHRAAFAHWEFHCGDFETLPLDSGDFIYADPPYDVPFTSYAKEDFGWADQVRLAGWLAAHPGPVVLSNQATDRIVALYESLGFVLRFLDAPRMISCTGDRARAREVLATSGI